MTSQINELYSLCEATKPVSLAKPHVRIVLGLCGKWNYGTNQTDKFLVVPSLEYVAPRQD